MNSFSADLMKPCWKLVKACLATKYFLFIGKSGLSSAQNNVTKQKEKPSSIHTAGEWTRKCYKALKMEKNRGKMVNFKNHR